MKARLHLTGIIVDVIGPESDNYYYVDGRLHVLKAGDFTYLDEKSKPTLDETIKMQKPKKVHIELEF